MTKIQAPSLTDSCGRWRAVSQPPRILQRSGPARGRGRPGSAGCRPRCEAGPTRQAAAAGRMPAAGQQAGPGTGHGRSTAGWRFLSRHAVHQAGAARLRQGTGGGMRRSVGNGPVAHQGAALQEGRPPGHGAGRCTRTGGDANAGRRPEPNRSMVVGRRRRRLRRYCGNCMQVRLPPSLHALPHAVTSAGVCRSEGPESRPGLRACLSLGPPAPRGGLGAAVHA